MALFKAAGSHSETTLGQSRRGALDRRHSLLIRGMGIVRIKGPKPQGGKPGLHFIHMIAPERAKRLREGATMIPFTWAC